MEKEIASKTETDAFGRGTILIAESKGFIIRDYRVFFMRHR
jgi:hypothetical protein